MDLRQLTYFVRIIELKSFSRASQQLRIAQPALGFQVRNLERELGQQLLIRHSRGVEPTEAGKLLLDHARGLLEGADRAKRALHELREPRTRIALGMVPSANAMLSANLAKRCLSTLPTISLNIIEELSSVLFGWVCDNRIDLACLYSNPTGDEVKGIAFEPLLTEPLWWVGASGVIDVDQRTVDFSVLAAHPLILPGPTHWLRQQVEAIGRKAGVRLNITMEAESEPLVKELVEQGMGFTVLPYNSFCRRLAEGRLTAVRINQAEISTRLCLAYKQGRQLSKTESAFRLLVHDVVGDVLLCSEPEIGIQGCASLPADEMRRGTPGFGL